jgi:SAM-dependent methyltransferase
MTLLSKLKRALRRRRLLRRNPAEIFSDYARSNKWGDKDSVSGKGSNLEATAEVRRILPELLRNLGATSILDVPCGDFFWMQHVDLTGIDYLGGDIVPDLIEANHRAHARPGVDFQVVDLISGPVPKADVIFVRDCLVHLSHYHVRAALANIARSGGTWLLTTTFPDTPSNADIATGEWRAIDLTKPPFNLPRPAQYLAEGQSHLKGQKGHKTLGLWNIADLQTFTKWMDNENDCNWL